MRYEELGSVRVSAFPRGNVTVTARPGEHLSTPNRVLLEFRTNEDGMFGSMLVWLEPHQVAQLVAQLVPLATPKMSA